MEISSIKLSRLRNNEHAEFHTEVDKLIADITPDQLGVTNLYAPYKSALANEYEALNFIRKSAITKELEEADQPRDTLFRGLYNTVKGASNHFNADFRKAAAKVLVVLDNVGNVARLPLNEETITIRRIIAELNNNLAAEVATLNLGEWLTQLGKSNDAFDTLMRSRYTEDASKTELRMKPMRMETDDAFGKIIKRINALIEINGETNYTGFVSEINQRIDKYNHLVARHKGGNDATAEKSDPTN